MYLGCRLERWIRDLLLLLRDRRELSGRRGVLDLYILAEGFGEIA